MRPVARISACHTSHRRLLDDLEPLTDADLRLPSLLPGYSRGHLVTHVTNKATAHVALFDAAAEGRVGVVHPPGYNPDREASRGAGRPAAQQLAALEESLQLLEAAWEALDDGLWGRPALMMAGPRTMADVVGHHLRNIEVHHVDLDIGYRAADWPSAFVEGELTKRLARLRERADSADLLAWLIDRGPAPELHGPW